MHAIQISERDPLQDPTSDVLRKYRMITFVHPSDVQWISHDISDMDVRRTSDEYPWLIGLI